MALSSTTNRSTPRARSIVSWTGTCRSTPISGSNCGSGAVAAGVTGSGGLRVRARRALAGPGGLLGLRVRLLLVGLLLLLLGHGGVLVDVLLAGEPHDLVHDLVSDRPQDVAVVLQALVAREVERLAEADHRPGEAAEPLSGWRDHVGAHDGDGDHRDAGLE